MKRYEKFVLVAEEGIKFEVQEESERELIVKAFSIGEMKKFSKNYANPPIPEGYKHLWGGMEQWVHDYKML